MSSKGQITIPKHVRAALGIEPGDALEFEVRGNEFVGRKNPKPIPVLIGTASMGSLILVAGVPMRSCKSCGPFVLGMINDDDSG